MFLFVHSYCKAPCADFCSRAIHISIIIMNAKDGVVVFVVVVFFARYSDQFYMCKSFIFFSMYLWTKLFKDSGR